MIYRATTFKTPTVRRIDWEGRGESYPNQWKLPFHLSFDIPLLTIRDIGLIVLAAAVAAIAVLIMVVALALPVFCPEGTGSDKCSSADDEIGLADLAPAPAVQMPAQAADIALSSAPSRRISEMAATRQDGIASTADVPPRSLGSLVERTTQNLLQFRQILRPQTRIVKTIVTRVETPPAVISPQDPATEETIAMQQAMIVPIPEPAHKRPASVASEKRLASLPSGGTRSTKAAAGAMTVGGSGVTVRSGPSKSRSSLFALGAGEKVAVLKNEKGWLNIRDSQGRVGWAYSRYLQ